MNFINRKNGFTLLEITVAMSIFIIFMILSTDYIIKGFRYTLFNSEQNEATQNAKKIMNIMIKEIREAAQSDRGDYLLDAVEEQSFSFYSNIDDNANTEKIRYFLDSGIFKKGIIEPTGDPLEYLAINETISNVAQHINNQTETIFTYYDTDYNLIADPSANKNNIRLIHISLKINVTPEIAPNDYYVNMDIQIRNLKDNL